MVRHSPAIPTRTPMPAWAVLICTFLLGACGGGPLRLPPAAVATKVVFTESHAGVCDLPPVHLDRSGFGGARPSDPEQECVQGFINVFTPGADPIPCWHVRSQEYIGAVRWDLDDPVIRAMVARGERLVRADIAVHVGRTNIPWNIGTIGIARNQRIVPATEPWTPGVQVGNDDASGIRIAHEPFSASLPLPGFPSTGDPERIDVTGMVQRWLSGEVSNHGMVLTSPGAQAVGEGVPRENVIGRHETTTMTLTYYLELELTFSR